MRHLLLIFLIAVLPVRGWAADVMSVAMASHELNAITNVANSVSNTRAIGQFGAEMKASMPIDCPMLASSQSTTDDTASPVFKGCTTCQLCMALVTGYSMMLARAVHLPQAAQGMACTSFSSAERAPGFRPPIS